MNNLFRELSPEAREKIAAGMRRKGKRGRPPTRVTSGAYKAWQKEAITRILWSRPPRFEGAVSVAITLTPRDSRRRDADNYSKAILDTLVKARVLADDSQVKSIHVIMEPAGGTPGAKIAIADMDAKPDLSANERMLLGSMRARGALRLVSPSHKPSKAITALVEKGRVEEQPGLIEGCPQGYVVVD